MLVCGKISASSWSNYTLHTNTLSLLWTCGSHEMTAHISTTEFNHHQTKEDHLRLAKMRFIFLEKKKPKNNYLGCLVRAIKCCIHLFYNDSCPWAVWVSTNLKTSYFFFCTFFNCSWPSWGPLSPPTVHYSKWKLRLSNLTWIIAFLWASATLMFRTLSHWL